MPGVNPPDPLTTRGGDKGRGTREGMEGEEGRVGSDERGSGRGGGEGEGEGEGRRSKKLALPEKISCLRPHGDRDKDWVRRKVTVT